MLKHYIIIAFRHLKRNRLISVINIVGLAVGITCCILIYLFVFDELQYNRYFPERDRLYRLCGTNFGGDEWESNQPAKFLPYILDNIPEMEIGSLLSVGDCQIAINDRKFDNELMARTDTSAFTVLGWQLIRGNKYTALDNPKSVVISEAAAKKYFGNQDPMGKDLFVDNYIHYTVTGVMKDIPTHSYIRTDLLVNDSSLYKNSQWGNFSSQLFFRVRKGVPIATIENKIINLWKNIKNRDGGVANGTFILQPIGKVYLHSGFIVQNNKESIQYGSIYNVIGFSLIGLLILIIACFNYLNLSTARAQLRAIETGIRKTNGAKRFQVIAQFMSESCLHVLLAICLALVAAEISLPLLNQLIGKHLHLFENGNYIIWFLSFIALITTVGSGFYPAIMMSGVKPISVLKGKMDVNFGKKYSFRISHDRFRETLVTFQFFIVIALIICAIIITRQISYIQKFDTGYNKEQILVLSNRYGVNEELHKRYNYLKTMAVKIPEIESVTASFNIPIRGLNNYGCPYYVENPQNMVCNIGYMVCDWEFLPMIKAEIIEGRNFDPSFASDSTAVILSESLVKQLGLENPVGRVVDNLWDGKKRRVIGVVKNIYFNDLHRPLIPTIIMYRHNYLAYDRFILFKIKTNNYTAVIDKLKVLWNDCAPEWTMQHFFLNDEFEKSFIKENNAGKLMSIFTAIAILLSISGLAGLVLFSVQKRTKEIGIRKAHGASVFGIMFQISLWHLKPVALATIFAIPTAYFVLNYWLNDFAYRINLPWWAFAVSAGVTCMLALITVCIQTWHTATRNPVDSLRYE
jgi:putative ABC transport system permease protein